MTNTKTVEAGTQHTFGPWEFVEVERGAARVPIVRSAKNGEEVAMIYFMNGQPGTANARLIASAPELLDVAKAMTVMGEHIDISQGVRLDRIFAANFKALRAAIAKAEGRAQ